MATVTIDSGRPEAHQRPREISKDKWRILMQEKKYFLDTYILHDCRSLLDFVQDADEMWEALGFDSAEDMILNGYGLEPEEVKLALKWLELKKPDEAVKYQSAVEGGRRLMTMSEAGGFGGRGNKALDNVNSFSGGNQKTYLLARLERDRPDILDDLRQGKHKSVNQAAIAAGIVKVQSPFDVAAKQLPKLSRDELSNLMMKISAILGEPT